MTKPIANADKLVRSTAKIITRSGNQIIGTGSGLLVQLKVFGPTDRRIAPALVTNKHVVRDGETVEFQVPTSAVPAQLFGRAPTSAIVEHDDPKVDLCVIPLALEMARKGLHNATFISSDDFFTKEKMDELTAIESITMIGYPNGLIDRESLYPITRRGITATPAFAKLNGLDEFMIDCACFPGSSGSPIFLVDQGLYCDKENNYHLGEHRFGVLGFLHAGPTLQQDISLDETQMGDLAKMTRGQVKLMMNLGMCVKAFKLVEMFPKIISRARLG